MSDDFGKRTVFSPPFEAPWGIGPRPKDTVDRNIVNGIAITALDPDVVSVPSVERLAEIADAYPAPTKG